MPDSLWYSSPSRFYQTTWKALKAGKELDKLRLYMLWSNAFKCPFSVSVVRLYSASTMKTWCVSAAGKAKATSVPLLHYWPLLLKKQKLQDSRPLHDNYFRYYAIWYLSEAVGGRLRGGKQGGLITEGCPWWAEFKPSTGFLIDSVSNTSFVHHYKHLPATVRAFWREIVWNGACLPNARLAAETVPQWQ